MIIHSYIYNQNKISLPEYPNYMVWNYNTILNLIKEKYSEWEVYWKRLILNKM